VIEVQNLTWYYQSNPKRVLDNINLNIKQGESVAILGPTGAGKTTLLYCLCGLIPHNFAGKFEGTVNICGMDPRKANVAEIARRVGYVFEDAESQLVLSTVKENLLFGLENLGLPIEEIERRIQWAIKKFSIEDLLEYDAHLLSGGQKQKVALLSSLVMQPDILLLDEPTSELDPISKTELYKILVELRENKDMTMIIVEQDLEDLPKLVDRVILLYDGKIIYDKPLRAFFEMAEEIEKLGVRPIDSTLIYSNLRNEGFFRKKLSVPLTDDEAVLLLQDLFKGEKT